MNDDSKVLATTLGHALSGEGAHVGSRNVFEGLAWKLAGVRPEGCPHTLFEILGHVIYWQDWVVKWLGGKTPPTPKHASGSWPSRPGPENAKTWSRAVKRFQRGLDELERRSQEADLFAKRGKKSRLEMLHAIASHNSYHLGQAVLLRQMLGAWPPPSGGLTW